MHSANQVKRNPGIALNLDWIDSLKANRSAIERSAHSIGVRRAVKLDQQVAWLLKGLSCIDLTTLSGDDTPQRVKRLCRKAIQPVRADILVALGVETMQIKPAAVCVYHEMVETAVT